MSVDVRPIGPDDAELLLETIRPAFEARPTEGWTPEFIPHVLREVVDDRLCEGLIPSPAPTASFGC